MDQEIESTSTEVTEQTPPSAETPPAQQAEEDDAAFGAGFHQARGTTPAKAEEDKPEPKPTTEEPPKTEAAPQGTATASEAPKPGEAAPPPEDEWVGVSPKVRSEIEAIRKQMGGIDGLNEQVRKLAGHIGGQASQLKTLKDAVTQATTSVVKERGTEAAPSQAQVRAAGETPAKWKQLREDYPDWAEALDDRLGDIETRIAEAAKASPAVDPAKLKAELLGDIDSRISTAAVSAETKGRVMGYLDSKHGPSWEAEIKSPEFDTWIKAQPKETTDLCASPRVEDASRLIDRFRDFKKKSVERNENAARLKRAAQPPGTSVTTVTEDPEEAFERGFTGARGT